MEKYGLQQEAPTMPRHPLPRIVPARPAVPPPPLRKGKGNGKGGLTRRAARASGQDDAETTGEAAT
jgi:hypothetical protein